MSDVDVGIMSKQKIKLCEFQFSQTIITETITPTSSAKAATEIPAKSKNNNNKSS